MGAMRRTLGALSLVLLALAACATPQTTALIASPGALPARAEVSDVPFFPQEENYCGPAALATVLAWTGLAVEPESVSDRVYTPDRHGTLQNDVLGAARRYGRLAVPVRALDDLVAEIAAGHPVLVFQNLAFDWYPKWHFAVAVAYDMERREITLRSGREAEHVTAMDTFERTWARGGHWALVVLKPDDLPARAHVDDVERAAASLERSGRSREAEMAYSSILGRWPDSYVALIGLGNVSYHLGELAQAEHALRRAVTVRPERAEAWNNLAYVLAAGGRKKAALYAAQQAIDISGDSDGPYHQTKKELNFKGNGGEDGIRTHEGG